MIFPSQLTTQATSIQKVKYFPIELYCANMLPNTTYDAYLGTQLINSYCKPYGKTLGAPLTSDATGKLRMQYMHSVPYNQSYLVNPSVQVSNLISSNPTISLVDPFGNRSSVQLNILTASQ
jgi:hypothetical protein